ncbi:MAG: PBP1A family penicillin-binding protein [Pyrinomonadaceae bacterium]|nr:PBP1A family penicillin-binding protein [Pyrinomonadaceae bacterium]
MSVDSRTLTAKQSKKRGWLVVFWLPVAVILAVAAGGMTGVLGSYYLNNSRAANEVAALAQYRPSTVTKVYADDGELIAEFALEKRIPIKEKDISKNVENAFLAVEDIRFYDHIGIDPYRIGGAMVKNITSGTKEGASTLTQQLAKNLFLSRAQTFERKINEWLVALQIERLYTKRQILEMYLNQIFLGAGSYGIESGAKTYFGKPSKDLTIEEAAMLAAIPRAPGEYSPTTNPTKALERRNLVIDQMAKHNFIPQSEANAAKAKPIKLADSAFYQTQQRSSETDYPVEEIRKELEEKYTTRVAQGGLEVYTTINVKAQELQAEVVRKRLRAYDRGREWRSDYQQIKPDAIPSQKELDAYKHPDWYGDEYEKGNYIKGLVMSVDAAKNEAVVRFGKYRATLTGKEMTRSRKTPKDELKAGFLCEFEIKDVDTNSKTLKVDLSQVPGVQAAMVTINAKTGEIPAMVGGYDFTTNKFNNATQALRQTGSAFKPFVYTAAVEWGMTPDMAVSGAPIQKWGWKPHNYDGSFSHPNVPLKIALAKSYNVAAVHLLDQVGIQTGAQMVRRFGITVPMSPVLPSALGATEVPLIEMVSAYSVFPNKGVRVEPHLIRKVLDRDGNVLEEWDKTTFKVTSEYVAGTMVDMMEGVVKGGGTATGATASGQPLAGKTGTVNDHTDVWFIGFTPTYVTGVWMGNPERKESLGGNMTGGHGAVPYFSDFMSQFMKDKPRESFPATPKMPADIAELNEQRNREELEKKEESENYIDSGKSSRNNVSVVRRPRNSSATDTSDAADLNTTTPNLEQVTTPGVKNPDSSDSTKPTGSTTKPPTVNTKPSTETPTVKKTDTATPKTPTTPTANEPRPRVIITDQTKKKGKKGDDDNR